MDYRKNKMLRFLSMLLCVSMLAGSLPVSAMELDEGWDEGAPVSDEGWDE